MNTHSEPLTDLADTRVKDQVLNRSQEWKDQLKARRCH